MQRTEAVVTVLVALVVGATLFGIFSVGKYYGDRKSTRENQTLVTCIERGGSPIECRLALKGYIN